MKKLQYLIVLLLMLFPLHIFAEDMRYHEGITVISGTYGSNCGQPTGNKTNFLANACNGQSSCAYTVNYTVIGDPAVGCVKNYVAEWRCGDRGKIRRAEITAPPEAGFGKQVVLTCN
ncbi:MAG: hypothetical protein HQK91_12085 [Nitrospirae bacterium]|nr:hypothetical protein [Nitrospirota bacterium]